MNIENYKDLRITNDFMFYKIMQDETLCKRLLEVIFNKKIKKINYQTQKVLDLAPDSKGIRLDVYLDDNEGTIFDLEMQVKKYIWLPKRTRYYQSLIDLSSLHQGEHYSTLNDSYVIFICNFDFFGRNRYIYHFENICSDEKDLRLNDGAYKVILNTKGFIGSITPELKAVLDYFDGKEPTDSFTKQLDQAVSIGIKNKEWQVEYMVQYMRDLENKEIGKIEGISQGISQGVAEVISKMLDRGDSEKSILELGYTPEDISRAKVILQISSTTPSQP